MMTEAVAQKALHPTAEWALQAGFAPIEVDCTTAVVLKILDNKCKMLPGEKTAVFAVYDVVYDQPGTLFDEHVHSVIAWARRQNEGLENGKPIAEAVHALRVEAEALIPKKTMKAYKAFLREGLFG